MKKTAILLIAILFAACDPGTVAETATTITKIEDVAEKEREAAAKEPKQLKNGLVVEVNPNTKVRNEINYKDGQRDGESKAYYPSGELWKRNNYQLGVIHGKAEIFYENGTLKRESNYFKGYRDGPYVEYFKSGNPRFELNFKKDVPLVGFKNRDYRGELIPNPKIVLSESKRREGESLIIRLEFRLEGKGVKSISSIAYELVPDGLSYNEAILQDRKTEMQRLEETSDGKGAYLEINLAKDYYFESEISIVAAYPHHDQVSVAVEESFKLNYQNVSGPKASPGMDIGHE